MTAWICHLIGHDWMGFHDFPARWKVCQRCGSEKHS